MIRSFLCVCSPPASECASSTKTIFIVIESLLAATLEAPLSGAVSNVIPAPVLLRRGLLAWRLHISTPCTRTHIHIVLAVAAQRVLISTVRGIHIIPGAIGRR